MTVKSIAQVDLRAKLEEIFGAPMEALIREQMTKKDANGNPIEIWIAATDDEDEYRGPAREKDIQAAIDVAIENSEQGWDDLSESIVEVIDPLQAPEYYIQEVTTTYELLPEDYMVEADSTSGAFTITLPALSTVPTGKVYMVSRVAGAGVVTIEGFGTETIEGELNVALSEIYERAHVVSGSTEWLYIGTAAASGGVTLVTATTVAGLDTTGRTEGDWGEVTGLSGAAGGYRWLESVSTIDIKKWIRCEYYNRLLNGNGWILDPSNNECSWLTSNGGGPNTLAALPALGFTKSTSGGGTATDVGGDSQLDTPSSGTAFLAFTCVWPTSGQVLILYEGDVTFAAEGLSGYFNIERASPNETRRLSMSADGALNRIAWVDSAGTTKVCNGFWKNPANEMLYVVAQTDLYETRDTDIYKAFPEEGGLTKTTGTISTGTSGAHSSDRIRIASEYSGGPGRHTLRRFQMLHLGENVVPTPTTIQEVQQNDRNDHIWAFESGNSLGDTGDIGNADMVVNGTFTYTSSATQGTHGYYEQTSQYSTNHLKTAATVNVSLNGDVFWEGVYSFPITPTGSESKLCMIGNTENWAFGWTTWQTTSGGAIRFLNHQGTQYHSDATLENVFIVGNLTYICVAFDDSAGSFTIHYNNGSGEVTLGPYTPYTVSDTGVTNVTIGGSGVQRSPPMRIHNFSVSRQASTSTHRNLIYDMLGYTH